MTKVAREIRTPLTSIEKYARKHTMRMHFKLRYIFKKGLDTIANFNQEGSFSFRHEKSKSVAIYGIQQAKPELVKFYIFRRKPVFLHL